MRRMGQAEQPGGTVKPLSASLDQSLGLKCKEEEHPHVDRSVR